MAVTIWGSASGWTLTALPLFLWMGEILFRTRLSQDMFKGLAPWMQEPARAPAATNVAGCAVFAAVSGSSAATCATIGKMTLPELQRRGYPDDMVIGTLAGAGTLGLLIPPSIIMIVYGVSADVSIARLFIAGVVPGILLALLFSGYIAIWALLHPDQVPPADPPMPFGDKLRASLSLIPVALLILSVLGSIYAGIATGHRSRRGGRGRRAGHLGPAALAELGHLQGIAAGRDTALLHDGADPRGSRVPHAGDGLHRTAAAPGRGGSARSGCRSSS